MGIGYFVSPSGTPKTAGVMSPLFPQLGPNEGRAYVPTFDSVSTLGTPNTARVI